MAKQADGLTVGEKWNKHQCVKFKMGKMRVHLTRHDVKLLKKMLSDLLK